MSIYEKIGNVQKWNRSAQLLRLEDKEVTEDSVLERYKLAGGLVLGDASTIIGDVNGKIDITKITQDEVAKPRIVKVKEGKKKES